MNSAQQILSQLGGNRFIAMTGAKMFTQDQNALNFRLPANFANQGINHVRIELNGNDLYDIRFGKVRGLNFYSRALYTANFRRADYVSQ